MAHESRVNMENEKRRLFICVAKEKPISCVIKFQEV